MSPKEVHEAQNLLADLAHFKAALQQVGVRGVAFLNTQAIVGNCDARESLLLAKDDAVELLEKLIARKTERLTALGVTYP